MTFISLKNFNRIAFDTETTGLKYMVDKVFGFSLSTPDGRDYYYDIRETPDAIKWINYEMRHFKGVVICHNASFDYRFSKFTGINLPIELLDCTAVRACCLNEHEATIFPWSTGKGSYTLDYLSNKYLGLQKHCELYEDLAKLFGGKPTRSAQMCNISQAPSAVVAPYAMTDTRLTLDLWDSQQNQIEKQGLQRIVAFEKRLLPTFLRAEVRGIKVDLDYAYRAVDELEVVSQERATNLWKIAGGQFNPNSPKECHAMFGCTWDKTTKTWTTNTGFVLKTTKAGNPQLDAPALKAMKSELADAIIDYKKSIKTKEVFMKKQVIGTAVDGRVYPNINQMKGEDGGTGTGRLSYSSPPMQQIPSRDKVTAKIVKQAFLPNDGQIWLESDMASFEVRVFAHLASAFDDGAQVAYAKNPKLDYHQWVADLMGISRDAQWAGQANAKQLNLSILFNSGRGAIAEALSMPFEWEEFTDKKGELVRYKKAGKDANDLIDLYHQKIGGVKELATHCTKVCERRGYVRTAHGRRLRFPRGWKSYSASAKLIQSTSADENKENWLRIEEALGSEGTIILNTHDSYSMSVDPDWKPIWERVRTAVERQTLRVPLLLDFDGVGNNWAEAKGL